jgi:cysteine desulfurase
MIDDLIYLDHNATTPLLPEVVEAVTAACAVYGNPSSRHSVGDDARALLDAARTDVAHLLGCSPEEVVFTSGGSEGANTAILGVVQPALRRGAAHIITSQVEHSAVLETCAFAQVLGANITYLPVDGDGLVDPDDVRRAIRPDTRLVTVMHANNETGVLQPLEDITAVAHECGVLVHTDAVQTAGKLPLGHLRADLVSISGHKFHAPKGVGALRVPRDAQLEPLIRGGSQERGCRAGTENLIGIAGMAAAARVATAGIDDADYQRKRVEKGTVLADEVLAIPGARLNGGGAPRLPETVNVSFEGARGESLVDMLSLFRVAASTGSACHAGSGHPSHVLLAMGVPRDTAWASVRLSAGRAVTIEQLRTATGIVERCVGRLRAIAGPPRQLALPDVAKAPV